MSDDEPADADVNELADENNQMGFEVGGRDQLAFAPISDDPEGTDQAARTPAAVAAAIQEAQVRIGTLLKLDAVSVLLGAGASVDCGGPLITAVPLALERSLLERAGNLDQDEPPDWLMAFYRAVRTIGGDDVAPGDTDSLRERVSLLAGAAPERLKANLEQVLSTLFQWGAALGVGGTRLRIEAATGVDVSRKALALAREHVMTELCRLCNLPSEGVPSEAPHVFEELLRKLLTRPTNLSRAKLFTLNYDTLVEQAADATGVVLVDGFTGTLERRFRPESFTYDLYFPGETTEGTVHRLDRVLHLYKLHGSVSWHQTEPSWTNPYGLVARDGIHEQLKTQVVYPTPLKYGETLGMPYAELFRRFSAAIVKPQAALIVIGYGFGDEHVNAVIRQALAIPSFRLVVVDPDPASEFVRTLRERADERVWIVTGRSLGTFASFVSRLLPDLQSLRMRERAFETFSALGRTGAQGDPTEEGAQ